MHGIYWKYKTNIWKQQRVRYLFRYGWNNYLASIDFIEGETDAPINLSKRNLDPEEKKKDFRLEYVPYEQLKDTLEENRENARAEEREFIID